MDHAAEDLSHHSKSTASEISEEVLLVDQKPSNDAQATHRLLNDNEHHSNNLSGESTTTEDDSTDTQILLLGSSRKQPPSAVVKPTPVDQQDQFSPPTMIPTIVNQEDEPKNIDTDSIEEGQNMSQDEAEEEVEEPSTTTKSVEPLSVQSELLADHIHASLVEQNVTYMVNVREQKLDKLSSSVPSKSIVIPVIDLSSSDERQRREVPAEPVMNVPFGREKLTQLCDEVVANFFWPRVQSGQSVLLADEPATVLLSDPALVAFFEVDDSSSTESQINTKSERRNLNIMFLARVTFSKLHTLPI